MELKKMLSLTRQAIEKYNMLEHNDHIAIAVSGGKDSMALLKVMKELSLFHPSHFTVGAFCVNLGFGNQDFGSIESFCKSIDVPFYLIDTNIAQIVFEKRQETNPCSLCSKMRKGELNYKARELGYNKVAYGHHKDDVVDTMFMSLLYEGQFNTFLPDTYFKDLDLHILRPFIYIRESQIKGFINKYNIPVCKNPCPVDGSTKRAYVNEILKNLSSDNPQIKNRMFNAIENNSIWTNPNIY